jgi:signal transduction histidine kinase
MTRLRTSLRARFLVAMIAPVIPAVLLAAFLYSFVNRATEQTADQQDAAEVAHEIATIVASGQPLPDARTLQVALPNDQVTVTRNGAIILSTPPPGQIAQRQFELQAVTTIPNGTVTVRYFSSMTEPPPYELIFIAAAPILLVVISAGSGVIYLSRALRRRVGQATRAADRVADGDFAARMGLEGQGEFGPLARAFDGMAARLDDADRNQRQFLGDLAHEIATPVTAISASALALADGVASTAGDRRRAAEHVATETQRLQALLSDLRRLTRLDIAQAVSNEKLSVDEICHALVNRFLPVANAAGVQLSVEGRRVTALGDRRLIDMIIGNFISNAIRYTPAGGRVAVDYRRHRHDVHIDVRDDGIGIPPEHLDRIFDRFYRIDEARLRSTGGSGLGLSIAMRAARELSGRIEVHSEPGTGSTFRLIFPVNDARMRSRRTVPPEAAEIEAHRAGLSHTGSSL